MDYYCTACGVTTALETACQHQAGRELYSMSMGLPAHISGPITAYIGLFRTAAHGRLASDKALRLMLDVVAMCPDMDRLAMACDKTVTAMRAKVEAGQRRKPLANHNYLVKVLADMPAEPPVQRVNTALAPVAMPARPSSKTAQGLAAILGD